MKIAQCNHTRVRLQTVYDLSLTQNTPRAVCTNSCRGYAGKDSSLAALLYTLSLRACVKYDLITLYLLNSNLNFTWRYKFVSYGGRHSSDAEQISVSVQRLKSVVGLPPTIRNKFVAPCKIQV